MPFKTAIKALSIKKIIKWVKCINGENPTRDTYQYMLKATSRLKKNEDLTSLAGIAGIAYSWMGKIPRLYVDKYKQNFWWKIRTGSLEKAFILSLACFANNSVVGASKILHLINPKNYPIFDSHIFRKITDNSRYSNNLELNVEYYILYVEKIRNLVCASPDTIEEIKKTLKGKDLVTGKEKSCRILELSIYLADRTQ